VCVAIPACGVYTIWQVALAPSATSWHVLSSKAPVRLVLTVTVPIGVVPAPRPASLTVTMQLVACPITTLAGEQGGHPVGECYSATASCQMRRGPALLSRLGPPHPLPGETAPDVACR
jgi:hypothetical protein